MIRTELIRPIPELLKAHAERLGDRPAYLDKHEQVSWVQLQRRTAAMGANLRRLGIRDGDRVAVYMASGVPVVESYFGIARANAVGVCVNPQLTARESSFILNDSQARVVITDPEHVETIRELRPQLPALEHVFVARSSGQDSYEQLLAGSTEAPDGLGIKETAWILYTSGTTGQPKGVQLTQHGMLWVVANWAGIFGLSSDDYFLSPLPLFHSYALNVCVLGPLALGATEYLMDRFSTDEAFRLLRDTPATFFPGVPTMFNYMVKAGDRSTIKGSRLRLCISAGAILSGSLNQEFEQKFGLPLYDGYGITETSTFVTFNWPTGTRVQGSCGLPLVGLSMRVVNPKTGQDMEPGHQGEIWVRGPLVTPGYINRPEANAEALVNGWYHTGDLAVLDENGYVTIVGRVTELIISGGYNIAPAELEEVAMAVDGVVDCCAVGIPHEAKGQVPELFVVWRDGQERTDELLAHLRKSLARYKVPSAIHSLERIPRTGSGKAVRYQLRERTLATDQRSLAG